MRQLILLWICMITFTFISCVKNDSADQYFLLEGQVNIEEPGYFYLIKSEDALDFKNYYKAIDSLWIDSSGIFEFKVQATSADLYQIRNQEGVSVFYDKDLLLGPNDTLRIQETEEETLFNGNAAALNQIQWDLSNEFYQQGMAKKAYDQRRTLEPEEFESYINKLRQEQIEYVRQFRKDHVVPGLYYDYLMAKINAGWMEDYWDYMQYHSYYAHSQWRFVPLDSFKTNIIEEWPDTSIHFVNDYKHCVSGYINYLHYMNTLDQPDSIKWMNMLSDKFALIKSELQGINRDIGFVMLSKDFWQYVTILQDDFYPQAQEINDYYATHKDSKKYYNLFKINYQGFLNIAPDSPAPDFSFPDSSGTMISLSQFEGKIVYINFWGTWCGPCIKSIPKHLELQQQLKNTDEVIFMYVALEYDDKDIERWKDFIREREWPGVHVVAKNQFHNEQLQPYKLNAAPSYVLIDQDGKIVSPRANGPDEILPEIHQLLTM